MRYEIDNQPFTAQQLDAWQLKRIPKVLRNLHATLPAGTGATGEEQLQALGALKAAKSYEERVAPIRTKLALSRAGMKAVVAVSGKRRKFARATIYAEGIELATLGRAIDALMLEPTPEHKLANLSVSPDHYALEARGDTLEVVETTGNTPLPTQFFITFGDETGLQTPRNPDFPYQSVGIAKLSDGTVIGGVRHQFRQLEDGAIEARTCVEFPAACPSMFVREHQKHLCSEWGGWISWAIAHQDQFA